MPSLEIELIPALVTGVGVLLIGALLVRWGMQRFSLPAVVGFLALGIALAWVSGDNSILGPESKSVLEFLGAVGVIVLLFRAGVESNLHELLTQLPKAAVVWLPNMILSGVPAFFVAFNLLNFGLVPSLFVAVAMTATSVGVSVAVWEETNNLQTADGELLLDTAELDDISGVALMALLFSIAPALRTLQSGSATAGNGLATELFSIGGMFLLKLLVFVAIILLLGKYLERLLAHAVEKVDSKPTVLVFALALGLVIAGAAGLVGLSLPVGALFAGLLLSRHRQSYGIEPFYQSVYALFVPFFFINIGYKINPAIFASALGVGVVLVAIAVIGKIAGTAAAAWRFTNASGVVLIGVSMIPRAEITMVVIERGRQLGDWAMPPDLYAAMVLVSAVTCLGASLFLHWGLRRWRKVQTSQNENTS